MKSFGMVDSGKRVELKTGSHRERAEGKGRYDLISPIALRRLAIVMEKGAKKYATRNWEKGQPLSFYMDSALRHLNQHLEGQRDEDHLGQCMFNVMAMMHTEEQMPELDDLPKYKLAQRDKEGQMELKFEYEWPDREWECMGLNMTVLHVKRSHVG